MKTTEELLKESADIASTTGADVSETFRRLVIEDFLREHEGEVFAWANEDGELTLEYYRAITGGQLPFDDMFPLYRVPQSKPGFVMVEQPLISKIISTLQEDGWDMLAERLIAAAKEE